VEGDIPKNTGLFSKNGRLKPFHALDYRPPVLICPLSRENSALKTESWMNGGWRSSVWERVLLHLVELFCFCYCVLVIY